MAAPVLSSAQLVVTSKRLRQLLARVISARYRCTIAVLKSEECVAAIFDSLLIRLNRFKISILWELFSDRSTTKRPHQRHKQNSDDENHAREQRADFYKIKKTVTSRP